MHSEQRLAGKKLSKAVLDLKFMKKSKEKAQLQEENEERQNLYQDQLLSLHEGADRIVMINSYYDCMDFLPCRLSFGGMDADIEKLNEDKLKGVYKVIKAPPPENITEMDTDVTAQEMAKCYQPTNKYGKRKSDHLDDYDTKSERGDNSSNICDGARERNFSSDSSKGKRGKGLGTGKSIGKKQGRPMLMSLGESSSKIRGKGRGNFRGKGRGRGNFRGSNKRIDKQKNCKDTDKSKGNFTKSILDHTKGGFKEDTDNKHSQKMQSSKKFKFMKIE